MRKTYVIIIFVLVCLVLIFVFMALRKPSGSLWYEGRHLSQWLLLVQSPSQQEVDHAEQAVRKIGADALPFLEELVENAHFSSSVKVKVGFWLRRKDFSVDEVRRMVSLGYGTLGDIAKPSVPFLVEKLKDNEPTVRSTAAGALGWIGPFASEAVPDLIALLKDNVGYVRRDAASALGRICSGSNNAGVIDALGEVLNDKDAQVRDYAKRALESVKKSADVTK